MKHTRTLLAFSLLLFNHVAMAAPAPGVLATVPITFTRNQVRIPVSVNGSEPFVLILDTGMPAPGIMLHDTERVRALGLKLDGSDSISGGGTGGPTTARVASGQRIGIGAVSIADVPVTVLPAGGMMTETDGVIGLELFRRYAVRVDVDNRTLDLIDKAAYQPPKTATVIPLRLAHNVIPFIDARVSVAGGALQPVDIAVDLGAAHALWLNQRQPGRLAPPATAIRMTLGRGLSGKIEGSLGRVQKLEIGNVAFENVVTLFPDKNYQNPGGFDFKDGFVGAEILTRFVVTFDYASKRMVLVQGKRFPEPFEADMTGMVYANFDMVRRPVDAVLSGSPAESAGIRAGDILVAVDGKPLQSYESDELKRLFRRDGLDIRVTVERDGSQIEKPLHLRRLL